MLFPKKVLCSSFLLLTIFSSAQDFDDLIANNRQIDCGDIYYNASSIIEKFYQNNEINKIYNFLNYWESKCGKIDETIRLKNVLDISLNRFNEQSISKSTIEQLVNYKRILKIRSDSVFFEDTFLMGFDFNRLNKQNNDVDKLIRKIARSSSAGTSDQKLLLDFYRSDDPSFNQIKNSPNNSKLKTAFNQYSDETLRMWELHYALSASAIQNYGELAIFGTRPGVAITAGGKQLRHNIDAVIDLRFGPSDEEYSFLYQDELLTDDKWSSVYIGAEYTYDILRSNKFDIGLSSGIGYESITAVEGDDDEDIDGKFLESLNTNLGMVFKYKYGRNGGYVGLNLRYNWVDYSNRGGTPLQGNYLNLRLTFGKTISYERSERLELLN